MTLQGMGGNWKIAIRSPLKLVSSGTVGSVRGVNLASLAMVLLRPLTFD